MLPVVTASGGGVIARGRPYPVAMEADVGLGFQDGEGGKAFVVGDIKGVD